MYLHSNGSALIWHQLFHSASHKTWLALSHTLSYTSVRLSSSIVARRLDGGLLVILLGPTCLDAGRFLICWNACFTEQVLTFFTRMFG